MPRIGDLFTAVIYGYMELGAVPAVATFASRYESLGLCMCPVGVLGATLGKLPLKTSMGGVNQIAEATGLPRLFLQGMQHSWDDNWPFIFADDANDPWYAQGFLLGAALRREYGPQIVSLEQQVLAAGRGEQVDF